jgi:hypothetical protein
MMVRSEIYDIWPSGEELGDELWKVHKSCWPTIQCGELENMFQKTRPKPCNSPVQWHQLVCVLLKVSQLCVYIYTSLMYMCVMGWVNSHAILWFYLNLADEHPYTSYFVLKATWDAPKFMAMVTMVREIMF